MSEWISVVDELPKLGAYGTVVIGCSIIDGRNTFVDSVTYTANKYAATEKGRAPRFEWMGRVCPWSITHWMPLPQPPEVK